MLLTVFAQPLFAQSTSQVGHTERPLQFELVGGSTISSSSVDCCHDGPAYYGAIGARRQLANGGGIRVDVVGLSQTSRIVFGPDNEYTTSARIVAVTASFDAFFRLVGDFGATVTAGAGFAPYVHGSQTSPSSYTYPERYSLTESSALLTAAVGIRYRWFFVEQQGITFMQAQRALAHGRQFFPVTLGVRF
ncbi:MAG: hypothetical protein ABIY52_13785 [Gemmatimonadaceae bacterium]